MPPSPTLLQEIFNIQPQLPGASSHPFDLSPHYFEQILHSATGLVNVRESQLRLCQLRGETREQL